MNYRNYLNQENPAVTMVIKGFGTINIERSESQTKAG